MSNVKVRVVGATVDGNAPGSEIEINAQSAKQLASLGYVEVLPEEKAAKKSESAPKPAKSNDKKSAPKTKDK